MTSLPSVEPVSHLGFSPRDDFSRSRNMTEDLVFDIVVKASGQDAFCLRPETPSSSSLQWCKLAFSW